MQLVKKICSNSDCDRAGRTITVKGLMLHSVGCNQPDPYVFQRTWDKSGWNVCAHAVIGTGGLVIQCLDWTRRGWHGGGSSNDTHIGVEMTEPATIKYTSGANFTDSNPKETAKHVTDTYNTAVELFAMLCEKYNLDPTKSGVIVSHSEGYKLGIASGHADVEHLWNKFGLTMNQFRKDVKAAMKSGVTAPNPDVSIASLTKIMGESKATEEQMVAYAQSVGASFAYTALVPIYLAEGKKEGVRGDIAFAQSLVETGNFKFGGDVKASQNNFAGIGATGGGVSGNSFATPTEGIRAQIQHLKAYASTAALNGECIDPRFKYVERGSAEYVEYLGIQENPNGKGWASAKGYGASILAVLNKILNTNVSGGETKPPDTKPETPADKTVTPYTVKLAKGTKIYTKPSATATVSQTLSEAGVFTIVKENGNFGYLKSGVGYVELAKATKTDAFHPYTVKVTASALNIRQKPSTDSKIMGVIRDQGIYTIVEVNGKWGKLKSGAGWIHLDYTKKH